MKISYFLSYKIIILIIILSGCSNNSITMSEKMDPFEKMNRKVFTFNKKVDEKFISPISSTYEREIPASTRKAIRNHIDWLDTPSTIINSSLQIDLKNTILASAKFMLNGLTLGFYDLDKGETAFKKKDIGSTLAKYNVPEGPFLMIPLIGPKTSREFTGTILNTNIMSNISSAPLNDLRLLEVPLNAIDTRSKLSKTIDNIYESPDPYIKLRSFYIQNRRNNVYGKKYINLKNKKTDAEFEKLLE